MDSLPSTSRCVAKGLPGGTLPPRTQVLGSVGSASAVVGSVHRFASIDVLLLGAGLPGMPPPPGPPLE
eukprot:11150338-Alexandrium_andersonii.AAC.1